MGLVDVSWTRKWLCWQRWKEKTAEAERWGGCGSPFSSSNICMGGGAEPGEVTLGRWGVSVEGIETSFEEKSNF